MEEMIFCRGGGCPAKLGAGALNHVLARLPRKDEPRLLVGFDSRDDAAVYQINEHQAILSTLDFFPPMIEDPYLFGQIAAANALSDVYAMGGEVLSALNLVCFPENGDLNLLGRILQGGNEKVLEAGGVLAGGHSIADDGIKYGLSVTGLADPRRIYRNNGCRAGDALILTKKLGVGIVMTAHRIREAGEAAVKAAVDSMTFLNKYAAEVLKEYEVHACTDVTGFGFLVHLSEMLDRKYSAVGEGARIPYFPECETYVEEFYLTAAAQKNRNYLEGQVLFETEDFVMEEILFDPQTSGGLLVSVRQEDAEEIAAKMRARGIPASVVGRVTEKQETAIVVKGR